MSVQITKVDIDGDCYVLWYENPHMPGLGHNHYLPFYAIQHRMALYNVSAADAVEEIIHEHLSTFDRDPDKFPTKADRDASKKKYGRVMGHTNRIGRHDPLDVDTVVSDLTKVCGAAHVQKVRGQVKEIA